MSAAELDRAHGALTVPWAFGAGFVPVVAQHRDAAVDMSAAGAHGSAVVSDARHEIKIDSLRPANGRIIDVVAALSDPTVASARPFWTFVRRWSVRAPRG